MFKLLTRDQFREAVFARDKDQCLVCKEPVADAHHILERRLWPDGGYYLDNGASLCGEHHLEAESTVLSCETIRELAGIDKFPLPPHLYSDQPYDKWGNPILPNGMRLRGELFDDISVQKILAPVLALFTTRVKYPRTYHLPWSPGIGDTDRVLENLSCFETLDCEVVVTVKMDGENTTLYSDYVHARSLEYEPHPSRSWVKALHARIAHEIPEGWRICGENLYAKHSIAYQNLYDYFQVFSVWDEKNICQSWDDTLLWSELLGLKSVSVVYLGLWDEKIIRGLYQDMFEEDPMEGYVVRPVKAFHYKDFRKCVSKYVRANHVTTHGHWMRSQLNVNKLR